MPYMSGGSGASGMTEIKTYLVQGTGACHVMTVASSRINMGGVKPILTLPLVGPYLILSKVRMMRISYDLSVSNIVHLYLRRASGTPMDIEASHQYHNLGYVDFMNGDDTLIVLPTFVYTTTVVNTVIEMWGDLESPPDSGQLHIAGCEIAAVYLK